MVSSESVWMVGGEKGEAIKGYKMVTKARWPAMNEDNAYALDSE